MDRVAARVVIKAARLCMLGMFSVDHVGKGDEAETANIGRIECPVVRGVVIANGVESVGGVIFMQR